MIHIVCYLHGGDPGREGRQLWSFAWPPCTALGLIPWPACLSVWSSSFHPLSCHSLCSLPFCLLPQHPQPSSSSPSHSSPTFLSCHPSPLASSSSHYPPPPSLPPRLPSEALHWIFHHKPPAACQSQRKLPPEAPTEGPASDIKRGITAKKEDRTEMGRDRQWASRCEISWSFCPIFNKRQNCPEELIAFNFL